MALRRAVLIPAFQQVSPGSRDWVCTFGLGNTQDIAVQTRATPKIIFPFPGITFQAIRWIAAANTAPTGRSIVIDLNKNGSSIFTAGSEVILPAANEGPVVGTSFVSDPVTFSYLDVLLPDVDHIGSIAPGFRVTVLLIVRPV